MNLTVPSQIATEQKCQITCRAHHAETPYSDLDVAFKVENAIAFQLDSVVDQPANNLSAARRRLKRLKLSLAQSLGPRRCQHAVRSASHRVFRNALGRGEIA